MGERRISNQEKTKEVETILGHPEIALQKCLFHSSSQSYY